MSLFEHTGFFKQGPFAETQKRAEDFSTNLTMAIYFEETVKQQILIEEQYLEAITSGDDKLAEQKRQELNMCEGTFKLTATLFDTEANFS